MISNAWESMVWAVCVIAFVIDYVVGKCKNYTLGLLQRFRRGKKGLDANRRAGITG